MQGLSPFSSIYNEKNLIGFYQDAPRWNYSRRPNNGITEEEARDFAATERAKMVEFLQGCDLAIMDTQYTDEEYAKHIGWGHSSLSSVVSLGLDSNVGKLLLFHHDPNHDDEMIDKMVEHARELVAKSGKPMEVEAAREGAEILLAAKTAPA